MQSRSLQQFLARIGEDEAASFSPAQLLAIDLHFGMRYRSEHLFDWRRVIRLPYLKFYLVVLGGLVDRCDM